MSKRGQAAAFIIIGLVILIVIIGVVAVKKGIIGDLFDKITTERQTIPQQVQPVQDFLDSCVTEVTKEGIEIVALQGGYLNIPDDPIPTSPFTPLGTSLEIMPDSGFKTAVWFRERGNGIQELKVPTKEDVEFGLNQYIESNFERCINNLTYFDDQGFITSARGIPKATTTLTKGRVSSVVDFPVDIKILDTNFTLSEHRADVETTLGTLYEMAKDIIQTENEEYFLENKTIDMLVAYDEEIPFSGTDLSCSEKIWLKQDVERKLKNIIFENVAAMRIEGTNYELQDEKYEYLVFDALSGSERDITVNLMYIPNWPTLIEITPSEGNILRSDQISKRAGGPAAAIVSSFFCMNQYRFVYDIKYPILITLRDEEGLTFQFATQVIIDNNQPRENRLEILDLPETDSPICQYPQRELTVFTATVDAQEEVVPLNNVSLSFKCFPATCPLGSSELTPDGEPLLTTYVPLCVNGVVEGYKEGYKQITKTFFSSNNQEIPPVALVVLEKIYEKEVNLFVIDKETGEIREPYDTEQITFQFIHTQTSHQPTYFAPSDMETIGLLPGEYIINSYILRNSSTYKITTPKREIETCVDTRDHGLFALFAKKQVCQTTEIEPIEFERVITGGVMNANYTFTNQELASNAPINLYVLSSAIPGNLDDIQRIQIEMETNRDHPLYKDPEIG